MHPKLMVQKKTYHCDRSTSCHQNLFSYFLFLPTSSGFIRIYNGLVSVKLSSNEHFFCCLSSLGEGSSMLKL